VSDCVLVGVCERECVREGVCGSERGCVCERGCKSGECVYVNVVSVSAEVFQLVNKFAKPSFLEYSLFQ
jgi:hypothetical protein